MRIIFMGTPDFAVPILDRILSRHEVVLVVTQPDSYSKRKRKYLPSPVKEYALEKGLRLFQPDSIRKEKDPILEIPCDLIVTAAYGQFVPKVLLVHPRLQAINVHGSLLPKYRGGAPIQRALIEGETKTGISIIYMTPKMDAGDILMQREIPIEDGDDADSLFKKLSLLGAEMILEAIDGLEAGTIVPVRQDENEVTFAYNLTKEDEILDFRKTAREIRNRIRGLSSNPGAHFFLDGVQVKVYAGRVASYMAEAEPGRIVKVGKDFFGISCGGNTVIEITEIQIPSKKRMSVRNFLNGSGREMILIGKEIDQ